MEGSSACNSGILPGDCLVEVNGKNVYCKGIELATKVHLLMHMSAVYAVTVFCCALARLLCVMRGSFETGNTR